MAVDDGGVLRALVVHLLVNGGGVVEGKEVLAKALEGHLSGIIQNVHDFDVACPPLAHLLIGWNGLHVGVWIHKAYACAVNGVWVLLCEILSEKLFSSPKAASTEGGDLNDFVHHEMPGFWVGLAASIPLFHFHLSVVLLQEELIQLIIDLILFVLIIVRFHYVPGSITKKLIIINRKNIR